MSVASSSVHSASKNYGHLPRREDAVRFIIGTCHFYPSKHKDEVLKWCNKINKEEKLTGENKWSIHSINHFAGNLRGPRETHGYHNIFDEFPEEQRKPVLFKDYNPTTPVTKKRKQIVILEPIQESSDKEEEDGTESEKEEEEESDYDNPEAWSDFPKEMEWLKEMKKKKQAIRFVIHDCLQRPEKEKYSTLMGMFLKQFGEDGWTREKLIQLGNIINDEPAQWVEWLAEDPNRYRIFPITEHKKRTKSKHGKTFPFTEQTETEQFIIKECNYHPSNYPEKLTEYCLKHPQWVREMVIDYAARIREDLKRGRGYLYDGSLRTEEDSDKENEPPNKKQKKEETDDGLPLSSLLPSSSSSSSSSNCNGFGSAPSTPKEKEQQQPSPPAPIASPSDLLVHLSNSPPKQTFNRTFTYPQKETTILTATVAQHKSSLSASPTPLTSALLNQNITLPTPVPSPPSSSSSSSSSSVPTLIQSLDELRARLNKAATPSAGQEQEKKLHELKKQNQKLEEEIQLKKETKEKLEKFAKEMTQRHSEETAKQIALTKERDQINFELDLSIKENQTKLQKAVDEKKKLNDEYEQSKLKYDELTRQALSLEKELASFYSSSSSSSSSSSQ